MIPSIRTYLLINLLLSITLITSFTIIGNLFLEHREVREHLDAQLALKTLLIQSFVNGMEKNSKNFNRIQNEINHIPKLTEKIFNHKFPSYEDIQFQVWNKQNQLILRSLHAPQYQPAITPSGFSENWQVRSEPWRSFASTDPATGITVITSEKLKLREMLELQITRDSVLIMLIGYPFLGLLIWIIVGHGLNSLNKVAYEVSNREPGYLEPVDPESVPREIKPIVEELNELFRRLNDALEREKRFAADAAHELRTPLAALKAHAQVALKSNANSERQEALHKVIAGVDRSAHVIQQLLTLSQMVPEASHGETSSVNLAKLAATVIADLAPDALAKKNTEIELDAPKKLSNILGFPTALHILIRNLVDNAVRYTPPNSFVRVYVVETSDAVILKVIDNGPGIPEELRERVFERFFRVLGNKSTGSGLGLGIVQQIATLHKASIALNTPDTGKGLEVSISFPK